MIFTRNLLPKIMLIVVAVFAAINTQAQCPITAAPTSVNGTGGLNVPIALSATPTGTNSVVWYKGAYAVASRTNAYSLISASLGVATVQAAQANTTGAFQRVGALPVTTGSTAPTANFSNGQFFKVLAPMSLDSMTLIAVNANALSGTINISLATAAGGGQVIQSRPFAIAAGAAGAKKIFFGATLDTGTYFMNFISTGGTGILWRTTTGSVYPYTINGLVSITGNNLVGGTARTYYFFDWIVRNACIGPKTNVTATAACTGEKIYVKMITDIYGSETSVSLVDSANGTLYGKLAPYPDVTPYNLALATRIDSVCIPNGRRVILKVMDSYGDGQWDGTNKGKYELYRMCGGVKRVFAMGDSTLRYGGVAPLPNASFDSVRFTNSCQTKNITFRFDSRLLPTLNTGGISIAGNFQGWTPGATPMIQVGTTGIYTYTAAIEPGTALEYKFVNGNAWGPNNDERAIPAACANANGNRFFTMPNKDTIMPVICFNKCSGCTVNVTFGVDIAGIAPDANGMHLAGSIQGWNPATTPMIRVGTSTVFKVTLPAEPLTTYEYKFVNGNAWGPNNDERNIPAACSNAGGNRPYTSTKLDTILPVVCFARCVFSPSCTVGINEELTQQLQVYPNPATDVVNLNYAFNTAKNLNIELYSIVGKSIYTRNELNTQYGKIEIPLTSIQSGVYYIKITDGEEQIIKQLLIQK